MVYRYKKHEIETFDSVQNLPIKRFQRFNKYQMQASEIGNTFQDYDQRTLKLSQLIQKKMFDEALLELENRRQTVFNAYNDFTPKGKAFAVLVKRIDNVSYEDFSPDALDRCIAHLESIGLEFFKSVEMLTEVKKKSKPNYWFIFQSSSRKLIKKIRR